ncbi:MAG: ECF transporter S component, partial [Nitrososphaerota archaeon]|nr:ECF transporter S component [Nitrososphaerota archaeon]
MHRIEVTKTRLTAFSALSIALVFVATSSISIYIPATKGYFNLGDSMIFLTAILFGPIVGGVAGGIGSMLSDVFLSYTVYAPATLVIKGIEGFITGKLYRILSRKERTGGVWLAMLLFFIPVMILGAIAAVLMFMGEEAELSLFATNPVILPSQPMFFTVLVLLAALIMIVLKFHKRNLPIIIPCFIGGFEMVLGYFIYQLFLIGFGAI